MHSLKSQWGTKRVRTERTRSHVHARQWQAAWDYGLANMLAHDFFLSLAWHAGPEETAGQEGDGG